MPSHVHRIQQYIITKSIVKFGIITIHNNWRKVTWSSSKALIAVFFLLRDSLNLSTVIGSKSASGPSSDTGGTAVGCFKKFIEVNQENERIKDALKTNIKKAYDIYDTSFSKRTLANRLLSVKESSKPSSSCKKNTSPVSIMCTGNLYCSLKSL